MSLINDMLCDLEARRSDEWRRQNLQGEVRPLPIAHRPAWHLPALLAVVVALALALFLAWWMGGSVQVPPANVVVPPSNVVAPPPANVLVPPVVLAPSVAPEVPREHSYELRSATSLSILPSEKPAPTPVASPTKPDVGLKPEVKTAALTEPASADRTAAPTPAGRIELKPLLATPRERAESEYRLAQNLLASGRAAEALDPLRTALRSDASHSNARQALIRLLLEQKRQDEAIVVLNDGLELQPNQLSWVMSLARLQAERADLGAAQRTLARSASLAAGNPDYLGFFGHVQYRLGHHREAINLYQAATRLSPTEGRWWFGLGIALDADGRASDAREAFRQALAAGNLNHELSTLAEQRLR